MPRMCRGRPPHHFYPRSPCGERPVVVGPSSGINCISIHALLAESDDGRLQSRTYQAISIHALLAESDWTEFCNPAGCGYFYPRSPCGERQYQAGERLPSIRISIHALLAESDNANERLINAVDISIHALLAESDPRFTPAPSRRKTFLSTLSLRRATCQHIGIRIDKTHFYPRSPCGERLLGNAEAV